MAIVVTCECGKQLNAKEELAGKRAKCSACGRVISVPTLAPPVIQEKASPSQACPTCQEALLPNAVICLNCGLDLRTGKPVAKPTKVLAQKKTGAKQKLIGGIREDLCPSCEAVLPPGAKTCTSCGFDQQAGKRRRMPSAKPKSKRVLVIAGAVAATLLVICVALYFVFREKPSVAWARTLASAYETRDVQKVIATRLEKNDKQVMGSLLKSWREAVATKTGDENSLDVTFFVLRYHPIWKEDILQGKASEERVARVRLVPKEIIQQWQKELERIQRDGVSELWTIGFLVDVGRLFQSEKFLVEEANILVGRLKMIPEGEANSLGAVLKVGGGKAAMEMVQQDWLFANNRFNATGFQEALAKLKEILQK